MSKLSQEINVAGSSGNVKFVDEDVSSDFWNMEKNYDRPCSNIRYKFSSK